jgi:hypothetical protein
VDLEVGPVALSFLDERVPVHGEAFTGGHQHGLVTGCELRTPDGGVLEVGLVDWEHGDRDVRCFSRLAGPLAYDRLVKGVRLGVATKRPGEWDCELGILSHHDRRPPTVVKAAWSDLDSVLGASARDCLLAAGARAAGTKEETIGDTGRRRGYLVMVCSEGRPEPPLTAYVLTRVLPLMVGFGGTGAVPVGLA